jgi:hypothetical protein
MVDMSEEEIVDRSIPVPGELIPGYTIPPVALHSDQCLDSGIQRAMGECNAKRLT